MTVLTHIIDCVMTFLFSLLMLCVAVKAISTGSDFRSAYNATYYDAIKKLETEK